MFIRNFDSSSNVMIFFGLKCYRFCKLKPHLVKSYKFILEDGFFETITWVKTIVETIFFGHPNPHCIYNHQLACGSKDS
jgi:hypothetical protein